MRLEGRRVLLGVSGGIAAYKAPLVLRLLREEGAEVRVVRTARAARFVTDPTLSVLSGHPVHGDLFAADEEFPVLHVGLAKWAELFLVAPATANLLGKMAAGIADDLLTTICLATPAPVVLAPAMEEEMLEHPRVQANAASLRAAGVGWIEPESGHLASGASGRGRMASPEGILEAAVDRLTGASGGDLEGLRILVTAGPTVEDLDPVRFLSNRSSGKMGFALARRARQRGAGVHLVSGPAEMAPPEGVRTTFVRSAAEMLRACEEAFEDADAAFMAAAVSDYRPRTSPPGSSSAAAHCGSSWWRTPTSPPPSGPAKAAVSWWPSPWRRRTGRSGPGRRASARTPTSSSSTICACPAPASPATPTWSPFSTAMAPRSGFPC